MAQEREPARSSFNSKWLTAQVFGRIAKSLELPTSAPFADLRQMVEGDRDPRYVEVILAETDRGLTIYLRDAEGDFLEIYIAGGRERTRRESVELADRRRGGRPQP